MDYFGDYKYRTYFHQDFNKESVVSEGLVAINERRAGLKWTPLDALPDDAIRESGSYVRCLVGRAFEGEAEVALDAAQRDVRIKRLERAFEFGLLPEYERSHEFPVV